MKLRVFIVSTIVISASLVSMLPGQDAEEILKRIDSLKGGGYSIDISAGEKSLSFKGKDAEFILEKLRSALEQSVFSFVWKGKDSIKKDSSGNYMIYEFDSDSSHGKMFNIVKSRTGSAHIVTELNDDGDSLTTIEIEIDDGNKIVTVTKEINGETKTETFTGKEADEYLKKIHKDDFAFFFKGKNSEDHIYLFEDDFQWDTDEDGRKITVSRDNGNLKVTVTTSKEGEEETKTYEGEEAERFLEDIKDENFPKIKLKKFGKADKIIIEELDKEFNNDPGKQIIVIEKDKGDHDEYEIIIKKDTEDED